MPRGGIVGAIRRWVPGVDTALDYKRAWLWPDIRSGIVLTALLIPAGIGYAEAAGLPAYTGLYATIVPLLAYAVFGPSRILVLGPDSSLAPIIAAAILPLALGDDVRAVALAGLLSIMVGVVHVLGGFLRLGFVTDLLSKPIRIGYLNGIALLVIISQVPKLLGFSIDSSGPFQDIAAIFGGVVGGELNVTATVVGLISLAIILVFRFLWRGRIPGVFIAVLGATIVTWAFGMQDRLPVVGPMPQGLPAPALGGLAWGDVVSLIGPALGIALIAFADTGVLSRTFAVRRGEPFDGSREMVGIGVSNIAGGLLGGFPVSASSSRTPVADQSGAKTQLTGAFGAVLILVFMLVAPGVTAFLPSSTLGAVVIVAASSFINVPGVVRLWRVDRADALLSLAAFLGVFLAGVLEGILVAIALSFIAFVIHSWRPYKAELGRIPGVRGYHDRSRHPDAARVPGLVIVRWDSPLFFANGEIFDDYVRSVVRDAVGDGHGQGGAAGSDRDGDGDGDGSSRARRAGEPVTPGGEGEEGDSGRIRTVILAAEPITDIDTTALDELLELDEYLASKGMTLIFAEMKDPVKDLLLKRHGLGKRFPPERFAPTVGAAVDAITGELRGDIGGGESAGPRA